MHVFFGRKKILCPSPPPYPQFTPTRVPRYDTSLILVSKRLSFWNCKGNSGRRSSEERVWVHVYGYSQCFQKYLTSVTWKVRVRQVRLYWVRNPGRMKTYISDGAMWCGRKVMRLATLCTNRQCFCLLLHTAVKLTPAIDSVQVWTCYSCCAIVESVWSEVKCLWGRLRNGPAKVWATLCHKISCIAWRIRYCDIWKVTKGLWRTFPIQGTSVQMAQVLIRRPRTSGRRTSCWKTSTGRQCGKSEVSCEVRSSIDIENDQ